MTPLLRLASLCALTGLSLLFSPAHAEKADRDKPTNIEADSVKVDDKEQTQIFEGNVQLTKGTLLIRADRIVVTQDADGYQRGVATSTGNQLPHFRQKREGIDEYIEGEAERIEHDAKAEKTEFYGRAKIKSGMDEVRGQFISYDAKTENYVVTSGPNGTRAKPGSNERVRAVIQSRDKSATPATARPDGAILKGATSIERPGRDTKE
ncbi:MAG: lipopolysaccharide transport periplasmic protein LptA [Rhodocyclales bacterium]|nr:lipopolysaccharide transport periplasmic protein LptA [Rhodocyclales bacterium]